MDNNRRYLIPALCVVFVHGKINGMTNEKITKLNAGFEAQAKKLDLTNDGLRYKSIRTARAWTKFLALHTV